MSPPIQDREASVELLRALEETGAMDATSLVLTDPDMTYERYSALGFFLGKVNRSCAFWIGDWLNFGEEIFGHYAAQAAEATGLAPQTLANRASVCRHVPPSQRRAALPFGVHAEVAYIDPKERERWLDKAELGEWTRAKLREEMRKVREIDSGGSVDDLIETGKSETSPYVEDHEEHPFNGVPAAQRDFLGEPVLSHPIQCPHCHKTFIA